MFLFCKGEVEKGAEFKQRVLPAGFVIGSNRPSEGSLGMIDLGLSVKWANLNIGANNWREVGDYFAWGEVFAGKKFGWDVYEFNDFHENDGNTLYLTKYCFDKYGKSQDIAKGGIALDVLDDAAYINWGEGYRMPTEKEFDELVKNCTFEARTDSIFVDGKEIINAKVTYGLNRFVGCHIRPVSSN